MFASPNQLNFKSTSRRDDLISLVYLMVYVLNRGDLINQPMQHQNMAREEIFTKSREAKMAYKISDLCQGITEDLTEFVEEVFRYTFSEKPKYDKLKQLLKENIVKLNTNSEESELQELPQVEAEQAAPHLEEVLIPIASRFNQPM